MNRREFLQSMLGATAAVAIAPLANRAAQVANWAGTAGDFVDCQLDLLSNFIESYAIVTHGRRILLAASPPL